MGNFSFSSTRVLGFGANWNPNRFWNLQRSEHEPQHCNPAQNAGKHRKWISFSIWLGASPHLLTSLLCAIAVRIRDQRETSIWQSANGIRMGQSQHESHRTYEDASCYTWFFQRLALQVRLPPHLHMRCHAAAKNDAAQQNHWSECGRAASVANSEALGRPHRSVLPLNVIPTHNSNRSDVRAVGGFCS